MRRFCRFLSIFAFWSGSFVFIGMMHTSASGREIFVAPYGDDAHEGTRERPVATLGRAADLVREIRAVAEAPEPTTVLVAAGIYYMGEGLHLSADDSGTREAPVTYRAMPGEEVRLLGAGRDGLRRAPAA